jgi:hypothetical protein
MGSEIKGNIAKARHRELSGIIKRKNLAFRESHSDNLEVLLENGREGIYHGFDQYFNRVEVSSDEDLSSNWVLLNQVEVSPDGNQAHI